MNACMTSQQINTAPPAACTSLYVYTYVLNCTYLAAARNPNAAVDSPRKPKVNGKRAVGESLPKTLPAPAPSSIRYQIDRCMRFIFMHLLTYKQQILLEY